MQRALNLALEGRADRDGIFIEDVSPAPDCGRLLAYVVVSNGGSVSDAIQALCQAAPWLRSEVTRAISRKRAPELFFIPANPQQGEADE